MDGQRIFQILGIEETKDEAAIKSAYRKKLTVTNPEDNPEGFKRLREAYEEALRLAKQKEETQVIEEDEVSYFIRRVDILYQSLADRLDEEQWKELVREPIFDDLELGEKAKWRLFSYLADHYRLPACIWRILDGRFGFQTNEQEFKEQLPPNFVDFLIWKSSEQGAEGDFPFSAFSGENRADYDGFIHDYQELSQLLRQEEEAEDKEQWKKAVGEKIAGMDSYGISHPWFTMQKARFDFALGNREAAGREVHALWETYGEDMHLKRDGAVILAGCGEEEAAEKAFLSFFEGEQDKNMVFDAHVELTRIYLRQNRILEAREHILDAGDIYRSSIVDELLTDANTRMIQMYTSQPKELTAEEGIRLAWGYIQTGRGEEGYQWFSEHPVLTEDSAVCHRAKAVLYLVAGHAKEALEEARLWQKAQPLDEKKDPYREAQSHEVKGRCLVTLYHNSRKSLKEAEKKREREKAEQEKKKSSMYRDAALRAFNEALKREPEDINFCMSKMLFCRDLEDYEGMLKLCQKIIQIDRNFYWGPFYAQEACEKLRKAQEVVDYFYDAKAIYAGRGEIYERAARVFAAFGQYSEVENILHQADEAGVDSPYLMVKRLELKRRNAKGAEEYRQADAYADEVIRLLEEKKKAGEEIEDNWLADAYMQRAYLQDEAPREVLNMEVLSRCTTRAVQLEDSLRTRYFFGRYLFEYKQDTEGAHVSLKLCEERGMEFEWLDYYLGRCEEYFGHWDKAIFYYKKAREKNPEEIDFTWRIGHIYQGKFSRLGQREYYDEAINYLDMQTEKFGADPEDMWLYAALYFDNGEHQRALETIEKAMEKAQAVKFWGRKGQLLRLLGRSKEAVVCLEKAIELSRERGQDYGFGYAQLYRLFCADKAYGQGVKWFQEQMDRVKTAEQKEENQDYLIELYIQSGNMSGGLEIIRRVKGGIALNRFIHSSWKEESERVEKLLKLYRKCLSGHELKAKADEAARLMQNPAGKKLKPDEAGKRRVYVQLADIYSNHLLEEAKGLFYYQKALQMDEPYGSYLHILKRIMGSLWRQGRAEAGRTYKKLFWERVETVYAEGKELNKSIEELYIQDQQKQKTNLYDAFLIAFFSGEYEKAKTLLDKLEEGKWCWDCIHKQCTEELECKGYWALYQGDKEQAETFFAAALKEDPDNQDAIRELGRLRGKRTEGTDPQQSDTAPKGLSGFLKRLLGKER